VTRVSGKNVRESYFGKGKEADGGGEVPSGVGASVYSG